MGKNTYTTNGVNQYTAVTGPDAFTPQYDPDGNLQNAPGGMHYTYNAENRLIAAQPETPADGDTRVEYIYDYMGRRVLKSVSIYASGAWTPQKEEQFVYDGWNMVRHTTIPDGGSAVDNYYVWGLDLSQSLQGAGGVGGLLATVQGSLTYHYTYDANGNVGQMIDASDGSIAAHYEYDPYGNSVNAVGALAAENAYRFSTKYFDNEVNLYYYGYRYYSPELGRWINRDPIGEAGSENIRFIGKRRGFEKDIFDSILPNEFNLYSFLHSNPLNKFDLLGLKIEILIGGPYGHAAYGHVALHVFGIDYAKVYDFGRYGKTWGVGGSQGEGMLRIWDDFCCYIAGENATGRTTYGYVYDTTPQQDLLIIDFFKKLISGIDPNLIRKDKEDDEVMRQYRLKEDYHAANNNCTTQALDGLAQGDPELCNKINVDEFDKGTGLSFTNKLAYQLAKEGSGVRMPLDLKKAVEKVGGMSSRNTYTSATGCKRK